MESINAESISGTVKASYSSYGEDMILAHAFKNQENGFYVDVGCYHPEWFSNTKRLFDQGWSGINIDPNVVTIELFNTFRPKDVNLAIAVSDVDGEGQYHKFLELDVAGGGSGNSLSADVKEKYEGQGLNASTTTVKIRTLLSVLGEYAKDRKIDFLNIDVEGLDLQVLTSNDWAIWRPRIVAVEIWGTAIDYDLLNTNSTYRFLRAHGYVAFSNTMHTWFFRDGKCDDLQV